MIYKIVKTATKTPLINYLSVIGLPEDRGQKIGVVLKKMGYLPQLHMFVWIVTGDTLSKLHHPHHKASFNQRISEDSLTSQKKNLGKGKTKKQFNKSFMCHSQFFFNIL